MESYDVELVGDINYEAYQKITNNGKRYLMNYIHT